MERSSTQPSRTPKRMATNMPTELIRSFVAIVDAGSMAQATDTIFLTQSALSLQMKRLEELLQQKLFRRNGRALSLTSAGEDLLSHARQFLALNDQIIQSMGDGFDPDPIHLGLTQDFADTILPDVLAQFHHIHPRARIRLYVAGTIELLDLYDRSKLDIILGLGRHAERPDGNHEEVALNQMVWLGSQSMAEAEELPLVLLEPPCAFRSATLAALIRDERAHRIVLETPNLPGMRAALRAQLGASTRTLRYAAASGLPIIASDTLPALPEIPTLLVARKDANDAALDLADLLKEAARARV